METVIRSKNIWGIIFIFALAIAAALAVFGYRQLPRQMNAASSPRLVDPADFSKLA